MPANYPYVWLQCDCYVWPVALIGNPGVCGLCKVQPHTLVDAPTDGKAHPCAAPERT